MTKRHEKQMRSKVATGLTSSKLSVHLSSSTADDNFLTFSLMILPSFAE